MKVNLARPHVSWSEAAEPFLGHGNSLLGTSEKISKGFLLEKAAAAGFICFQGSSDVVGVKR